ncbi:MAG: adenylate/guanylate cyclase domain-containing protein [Magnetococcales bacterium]|nr:adenylate/guanylate cyclase domain-containing protein [Magnetococcales bacterium]
MGKIFKRYDLWATMLLFLLAIPAERHEFFSLLEDQTLSFRHLLRMTYGDPEKIKPSDHIVLVNTDEEFFKKYGSYPLRRTDIARIAENLRILGAKVVALDILMDFPSSYGEDGPTAEALARAGNVLVVSQAEMQGEKFIRLNYPTAALRQVTRSGYTNISSFSSIATSMNRLRVFPEITREQDGWPFAVQLLSMFWDVSPRLEDGNLKLGELLTVPLDRFNSFYIDFPALPPGVRFLSGVKGISATEFLDISGLDDDERYELGYWVKDKIVLVGDTSEVSHDWFDTPVGTVYGVEIIADTVNTLMRQAPLRPATDAMELMVTCAFMLVLILSTRFQHPAVRSVLLVVVFAVYAAVLTASYVYEGLVFSMSYNLVAGVFSFTLINLHSFLKERGQKAMIKSAFGQYLSPEVVEILVKDPSKLSLGGEERRMTAFFSDVAGFSSISEKLAPPALVQLLNEYLTAMCDIIATHRGTVDKFEGDAIIAFWGAPLDQPDHAVLACHTAIDMQKYMVGMRQRLVVEGRPVMNVRIGLNSGPMVVGNMGSAQRMDYTIMGDAVNLAARLEGANKFYGTYTMVSQFTQALAADRIDVRELDIVRVVGKKEPVTIYELLDRKNALTGPLAGCVEQYLKGLTLYRERNFGAARAAFAKALEILEDDGPSQTYLARCDEYLRTPPPADWDGVFQFTSKG